MSTLLEVRGLTVELPTPVGWLRPVNEVSLRITAGESLGLVGESGSGKTMLSLALMGLLPPGARVSGEASLTTDASSKNLMALSEREWREVRGGEIAMVFHHPRSRRRRASGGARRSRPFQALSRNSPLSRPVAHSNCAATNVPPRSPRFASSPAITLPPASWSKRPHFSS
jgi:ABC-type oligopeptide transport system ATPase subunit